MQAESSSSAQAGPSDQKPSGILSGPSNFEVTSADELSERSPIILDSATADSSLRPPHATPLDSGYGSFGPSPLVSYSSGSPASPASSYQVPVRGRAIHPISTRRAPHRAPTQDWSNTSPQPQQNMSPPFAFDSNAASNGESRSATTSTSSGQWGFLRHAPPVTTSPYSYAVPTHNPGMQMQSSTGTTASGSFGVASRKSSEDPETDDRRARRSPSQLIQAAEALEEQANSLRGLALRRQSFDTGMQVPPPRTSQFGQWDAGSHQAGAYTNPNAFSSTDPNALYDFDPATFFRQDGSLRSGLTPGTNEYASWDDVQAQQQLRMLQQHYSQYQRLQQQQQQQYFQQQQFQQHQMRRRQQQPPQSPQEPNGRHTGPDNVADSPGRASARSSVSASSSADGGSRPGRMQRAFYNQLAANEHAARARQTHRDASPQGRHRQG